MYGKHLLLIKELLHPVSNSTYNLTGSPVVSLMDATVVVVLPVGPPPQIGAVVHNSGHSSPLLLSEAVESLELPEEVFLFLFFDFLRIFFTCACTKAYSSLEEFEKNFL